MFASTARTTFHPIAPVSSRRDRQRGTSSFVVRATKDVSNLSPGNAHREVREVFSIAAKPATPKPTQESVSVTPWQAFGVGFVASAAIIKAHIQAKSGSKLRRRKSTLRYFDARGAAEVIRTLFAAAELDYEDYRYTFSMDGPKPQICEQHGVDKESGLFDGNLKRLPVLEVNGQCIGQSRAIERFAAKDLGFYGKGPIEGAKIDAYCEHVRDLKDAWTKVRGNPFAPTTAETEEAIAKWYSETMKTWMEKIEACTGEEWAVGKKMSLADITLYVTLTQTFSDVDKAAASYESCPKIASIVQKVGENKGIKSWLETRPDNRF